MNKKARIIFSILLVVFVMTTIGIAWAKSKEHDIREVVWIKLSLQNRSEINGTWRDATLERVIITDNISFAPLNNSEYYRGKTLYRVKFNTTNDELLGPYVVYVDPKTNEIVGYGFRC